MQALLGMSELTSTNKVFTVAMMQNVCSLFCVLIFPVVLRTYQFKVDD